jgi:hypothetical protein
MHGRRKQRKSRGDDAPPFARRWIFGVAVSIFVFTEETKAKNGERRRQNETFEATSLTD